MRIAIYNENCVLQGEQVPQKVLDEKDDPDSIFNDWTFWETDQPPEPATPFLAKVRRTLEATAS